MNTNEQKYTPLQTNDELFHSVSAIEKLQADQIEQMQSWVQQTGQIAADRSKSEVWLSTKWVDSSRMYEVARNIDTNELALTMAEFQPDGSSTAEQVSFTGHTLDQRPDFLETTWRTPRKSDTKHTLGVDVYEQQRADGDPEAAQNAQEFTRRRADFLLSEFGTAIKTAATSKEFAPQPKRATRIAKRAGKLLTRKSQKA